MEWDDGKVVTKKKGGGVGGLYNVLVLKTVRFFRVR